MNLKPSAQNHVVVAIPTEHAVPCNSSTAGRNCNPRWWSCRDMYKLDSCKNVVAEMCPNQGSFIVWSCMKCDLLSHLATISVPCEKHWVKIHRWTETNSIIQQCGWALTKGCLGICAPHVKESKSVSIGKSLDGVLHRRLMSFTTNGTLYLQISRNGLLILNWFRCRCGGDQGLRWQKDVTHT